ncbi:pilus assembly FimT family protein [Burkholderia guangdongensis]|uniref:pilus assembly FimT family protein n=1 Tax=Burkholderia guangdongensis TaxID=1792500 RepID=UPI001FE6FC8D|nr:GspH/FimT family pseudopilin [Burkholderia guangdongensis]
MAAITAIAGREVRGFTLVELMIVLALLAGLGVAAAPAFEQWRMRERVDARSRMLLGALAFARAEAARLGVRVALCRVGTGGECLRAEHGGGTADWSGDWAVRAHFIERERVLRRYPRDREVVVAGALHELAFAPPAGQVTGGMRRFELYPRNPSFAEDHARAARCIRISAGGRARVAAGRCQAA